MKNIESRLFCFLLMLVIPFYSDGQEKKEVVSDPLSDFSILIGGEWYLDNSFQTFEWGLGKLSVIARSYFLTDGKARLVSEGMWLWHPGSREIKGQFTAIDMPYDLFEYTTRFEESKMVNHLTTYSKDGKADNYLETWEFTGKDEFIWTLYSLNKGDTVQYMEGRYTRR